MTYENVKAGDYLWVGRAEVIASRRMRRLVRVTTVTPKQIKTSDGGGTGNIYKKEHGRGVGSTLSSIFAVATAAEVTEWQAMKNAVAEESAKRTAAQEKENAWRKEVVAPIPFSSSIVTGHDGKLSLELYGLDRADIERIVKTLSELTVTGAGGSW